MIHRKLLLPLVALAALLFGCDIESPQNMGPAPPFTLSRTDGGSFTLAEAHARGPAVVNFFATW